MAKDTGCEIMTIDDLAAYLKLSKSSLYKMLRLGKIPGQKVGRHWRFHKDVIDQWIKGDIQPNSDRGQESSR